MTQCAPTALCYVWHNEHQQHFFTYGTIYTNRTLLHVAQYTPTAICYVWHSVHQHHFVTYGTMNTNSILLRVTQYASTARCYIWHNVHQHHFVTYGTIYTNNTLLRMTQCTWKALFTYGTLHTSAQEINFDLGRSCRRIGAKINSWLHVADVLHLAALLVGLQSFLVRTSWIHYARYKYLLCSWIWI